MTQLANNIRQEDERNFFNNFTEALFDCKSPEDLKNFLEDVATPRELQEMSARWAAAQLLNQGFPYRKISEFTGLSTTTVTRVANWMKQGTGGYQTALENAHHVH